MNQADIKSMADLSHSIDTQDLQYPIAKHICVIIQRYDSNAFFSARALFLNSRAKNSPTSKSYSSVKHTIIAAKNGLSISSPVVGHRLWKVVVHQALPLKLKVYIFIYYDSPIQIETQVACSPYTVILLAIHRNITILSSVPKVWLVIFLIPTIL